MQSDYNNNIIKNMKSSLTLAITLLLAASVPEMNAHRLKT